MGLCSRLLRRPRHRTGSLSMETTRYRADLRQVDTPLYRIRAATHPALPEKPAVRAPFDDPPMPPEALRVDSVW